MSAGQQFIGASIEWALVVLFLGLLLFVFVRVFCAPKRDDAMKRQFERYEAERLREYGKEEDESNA